MGAAVPADGDGRVLFEAFTRETVAARDVRETDDVRRTREAVQVATSVEVERRLRDLGYL
jgi:hypothetical protein